MRSIHRRLFETTLISGSLICIGSYLFAQGVPGSLLSSLAGNELVTVQAYQANGFPSPYNNVIPTSQLRNATGYQLIASATSGTIAPTNLVNNLLLAAQPNGTTTINTPLSPYDAELFAVCNVTNSALSGQTVTLAAAAGSSLFSGTVTALGTLAAHGCEELQYDATTTTWYQVR
jgi:hypothetical protein